jgi:hypothetical protein
MQIQAQIPDELELAFEDVCRAKKCQITDVLIMLIENFVQTERISHTPYQRAIELGLVGSFDGPEDLSERAGAYVKERLNEKYDH